MKNFFRIAILIFCCTFILLINGCGFHFRGTRTLPPQLRTLYLDIDKPQAPFSQAVRALLLSLHIHLVSSPNKAPYILKISYEFTHSTPNITSSTQTVSYNFKLRIKAAIGNNKGNIIVPTKGIGVSHALLVNSNQIYIPNTATFVEEEIGRNAINILYFWLTNKETHEALNSATTNAAAQVKPPLPAIPPTEHPVAEPEPSEPPSAQTTQENLPAH